MSTLTIPTSSPLSRDERETIIRWDDDARTVTFYTASPAVARRWTKLGHAIEVKTVIQGQPVAWQGTAEVRAISLRGPQRRTSRGFGKTANAVVASDSPDD